VLLDINMPGTNGVEVCRELRRLFPRLAILMLTVRSGRMTGSERSIPALTTMS
jgi:DNA-binding response OmpR family regulator